MSLTSIFGMFIVAVFLFFYAYHIKTTVTQGAPWVRISLVHFLVMIIVPLCLIYGVGNLLDGTSINATRVGQGLGLVLLIFGKKIWMGSLAKIENLFKKT